MVVGDLMNAESFPILGVPGRLAAWRPRVDEVLFAIDCHDGSLAVLCMPRLYFFDALNDRGAVAEVVLDDLKTFCALRLYPDGRVEIGTPDFWSQP